MPIPAPSPDARAVVTGASQNIGEALATELAARGHSLIVTARREALLTELAARLTDKYRVAVEVRPADLADQEERTKLCDELAERHISILCANAGTGTFGPLASLDPVGEKAQVQLNAVAVHDLTLAVLPDMVERKAGGILISGSAAGNSPIPYNATYAATKAFANTFSESLRGELRGPVCMSRCWHPDRCVPTYPTRPRRRWSTGWCRSSCGSRRSTPPGYRWMPWSATKCVWFRA
ncbi:short chain dehydrogenase family protein [Mycobacterium kansasii 732]|nr:short chain dehydrogenase family protein [Mycobacterium kansasii 732]